MSAEVVPFPLSRRQDMITRQSRYAADLRPDAAERFIHQQLQVQADVMRRRGVDEHLVRRELGCMEAAIRRELGSPASGGSSA
jgi:hypothetical protein